MVDITTEDQITFTDNEDREFCIFRQTIKNSLVNPDRTEYTIASNGAWFNSEHPPRINTMTERDITIESDPHWKITFMVKDGDIIERIRDILS